MRDASKEKRIGNLAWPIRSEEKIDYVTKKKNVIDELINRQ